MKKVEFQADDFGYNNQVNKAVRKLVLNKKIDSFSVLPNYIEESTWIVNFLTNQRIAAHINLIEGKPVSSPSKIKTLVDKNGLFYPLPLFTIRLLLRLIKLKEISQEIEVQLLRLKSMGIIIDEINSHQHLHALSPVAEIVISMAKKYKIKKIRSYKNILVISLRAKIYYLLLKICAFLSYFVVKKRVGLPITWSLNKGNYICFMSWEGRGFSLNKIYQSTNHACFVIHPGLGFDKNISYSKLLK